MAGPNGFYGQLLDLAGGTNIFADLPGDFGQVGAESILQRDPEIIILTDADLPFNPQSPDMVRGATGMGRDHRGPERRDLPGAGLAVFNARAAADRGSRSLARMLHPDRFAPNGQADRLRCCSTRGAS